MSQWKSYFNFCEMYGFIPLPATECVACLYITHLSHSLKYNSIVNYLSGLWALHKMYGYHYPDPSSFLISSTLRGAKHELGAEVKQAPPMTVNLMRRIFLLLDVQKLDDLVFWLMLVAGARGLFRKSNLCEKGYAICVRDVEFCDWGVVLSVRKSKTITFGERVFKAPFARIYCSCFCFDYYLRMFFSSVKITDDTTHLFSRIRSGKLIPATYAWFSGRLRNCCQILNVLDGDCCKHS